MVGPVEAGKPPSIAVDYRGRSEIILMPGYLALQYLDAFDMALEICDAMDIPQDDVVCGLASFPGAPGRGKVSVRDGVVYVCDRNPGVSMLSLKSTADILARMGISDGIVMQVSMSGDKVCDGLDMGSVEDFAASRGFSIVPEGQGLPEGTRAVIHAVKELYQ